VAEFETAMAEIGLGHLDLYLIHALWRWNEMGKDCREKSGVPSTNTVTAAQTSGKRGKAQSTMYRLGWGVSHDEDRPACVEDLHQLALDMPHVTVEYGTGDNPVYQVGRKSFIFFRNPRPDAVDPATGERYTDVIVFWVESEADKQALIQDQTSPFFTTAHFDGHPSVLLRASRIDELTRRELAELIQDAWLSRASARRVATWLREHPVA
jgi:hypothetical protein